MNNAQKIASACFDISVLADEAAILYKTHTVGIKYDAEGKISVGIEIVGKASEQYQDIVRETTVSAIKRGQSKGMQIDGSTDDGAGTLFELGESRNMRIAIAVTVGLVGFVDNGAPVKPTPALLKQIYTKFPAWQEKVLAALEADANFLAV